MKLMILAGGVLIAALAACGGGSGGALPSTAPIATVTPGVLRAQALGPAPVDGNGSPLPYVKVIVPTNGFLSGRGEAFQLAAAVPVFNIGAVNTVGFEFVANTAGLPVAVQVGTTANAVDQFNDGVHPYTSMSINGKTSVQCGVNDNNYGPNIPTSEDGIDHIQYFICAGNPFS